jgi:hypothetical protein
MFESGNRSLDGPLGALIYGFAGCALQSSSRNRNVAFYRCAKIQGMWPAGTLGWRFNSAEPLEGGGTTVIRMEFVSRVLYKSRLLVGSYHRHERFFVGQTCP